MAQSRTMESRVGRTKQRYSDNGERLVAGIVPTNKEKTFILLIQSTRRAEWVLPKGGWETDEECIEAAEREAWEEAGIVCKVDYDLGKITETRTAKQISKNAPKALYQFYEATVTEEKSVWPESHKRSRKWFSYPDALEALKPRPELVEAIKRSTHNHHTTSLPTNLTSTSTSNPPPTQPPTQWIGRPDNRLQNEQTTITMAHAQAHPPPPLEALSLEERAGAGGPGQATALGQAVHAQQAPQQLPPQMFTTAAQLLDLTDKKLMVALRDGRKLIGVLRSWDQFANLVLQSTSERLFTHSPPLQFADVARGTFLVRGENVLLLGEVDLDKDDDVPVGFERGEVAEVQARVAGERAVRERKEKERGKVLRGEGFVGEDGEGTF
ncbi:hypothetical protein V500_10910 [Pseudogymnoascus sp. VKM F-4518 (FW-2643)]|nr:hypothetical protein V500_10910 [Pseudogymnoascus sp. VKM F-4518 (FW-2643)]